MGNRGLTSPASDTAPQCDGCPYRSRSLGYVGTSGRPQGDIVFITDHPTFGAVSTGRPYQGGEGRIFRGLLSRNTQITQPYIIPAIRCCPIEWIECSICGGVGCEDWTKQFNYEFQCDKGSVPKIAKHSLNYIRVQPSAGQIAECAKRYLREELDAFEGNTLVGCGTVAMRALGAKGLGSDKANGTIYEYAPAIECTNCSGLGSVTVMVRKKCRLCPRPTYTDPGWRCQEHPRYAGKGKPRRRDCDCDNLFTQAWTRETCNECNDTKELVVEKSGKCPECKGKGVPKQKTTAHVLHDMLKPGQLLIATYDPLELMKKQNQFNAVDSVFKRIESLHDEDILEEGNYNYFPDPSVQLSYGPRLSVDIETPWNGDPRRDKIIVASICDGPENATAFKPDDPRFLEAIANAECIIGQNYTLFDAWWLYHHNGTTPKSIFDTRFAGHLLNPDTPNNLITLCAEYAEPAMPGYWKTANNYKHRLATVCNLDTDGTYRVSDGQTKVLKSEGTWPLFRDHVIPLSSVVLDMRIGGMRINTARMATLKEEYVERVQEMRKDLPYEGTENSKNELRSLIYDKFRLPEVNKRQGERNTRADTLQALVTKVRSGDIICEDGEYAAQTLEQILTMRRMSKLASTFLSYKFEEGSDFIHPILNPAGTGTLRLSCSNPNTQQIPADTRPLFTADSADRELTAVDIKQAEVVSFLWMAEEFDLYNQVLQGADIHDLVADLCNISRKAAKTTTFALLFGEEPESTAVRLGISVTEVGNIRAAYFKALPGVQRFRTNAVKFCRNNDYVLSPWGTRRHIKLEDWQYRGHAINQAMNTPIQSTPAIAIRIAMVNAARGLPNGARLWMQVHDEIIVEHDMGDRHRVVECLREAIGDATRSPLLVGNPYGVATSPPPLEFKLDFSHGNNWGEL